MAPHCCVPQCTSSHRKKSNRGQTFHRFPNDLGLRREWIIKIKRDPGRHFKINTYTKVCSEHFLPDCLVKTKTGITKLKQGAVPTVFAWSSFRPEWSEATPPPYPDHKYAVLPPSLQDQLEEARMTITDQEILIAELQQQLSNVQSDDKQISFYTGFTDYATFKAVFMALQPTAENMVGWSQAQ
ncbi:unnamed protein product [Boreogadus saida]